MQKYIFIAEAAKLCKVDKRTFDKWVKNKIIKVAGTSPPRKRYFLRKDVEKLAKSLPKKRMKGFPILP